VKRLAESAKSLLLMEFLSAFWLALKYFVRPKATLNYPFEGGPLSPHQIVPKGEAAARRAIALDETVPRAHQALGQFLILYHWREEEGLKELERASELQGGERDEAMAANSRALSRQGRFAILEFATPTMPGLRTAYRLYSNHVLPRIGALLSKHDDAYGYLPASIEALSHMCHAASVCGDSHVPPRHCVPVPTCCRRDCR